MTQPDVHGAIVRSLTDTQRERLRGIDLTNIANAIISDLGLRECNDPDCRCAHAYVTDLSTTDEGNHP